MTLTHNIGKASFLPGPEPTGFHPRIINPSCSKEYRATKWATHAACTHIQNEQPSGIMTHGILVPRSSNGEMASACTVHTHTKQPFSKIKNHELNKQYLGGVVRTRPGTHQVPSPNHKPFSAQRISNDEIVQACIMYTCVKRAALRNHETLP